MAKISNSNHIRQSNSTQNSAEIIAIERLRQGVNSYAVQGALEDARHLDAAAVVAKGVSISEQPEPQKAVRKRAKLITLSVLRPQLDGEVVIFNRGDVAPDKTVSDLFRSADVHVYSDPFLMGQALGRRRAGLLVELTKESGPDTLDRLYRAPSHFPRYTRVQTLEGLSAALNNHPSWVNDSRRYTEQDKTLPLEQTMYGWLLERINKNEAAESVMLSGRVTDSSPAKVRTLIDAVAESTQRREVDPSQQAEAGFLKGYTSSEIRNMMALPGAQLHALVKGEILLGYFLVFLDEKGFPARGKEIAKALNSRDVLSDADRLGYAKIMEVTPAGRDFGRILGIDLYQTLDSTLLDQAETAGVSKLIGECRAWPAANREALRAHATHGWKYSDTLLARGNGGDKLSFAALHTREVKRIIPQINAPLDKTDPAQQRRGLRSGESSWLNYAASLETVRLSPGERQSLLREFLAERKDVQFCTGSNYRCQEQISYMAHNDGSVTIRRWIWDSVVSEKVYDEEARVRADGSADWSADRLLTITKHAGQLVPEPDPSTMSKEEYLMRQFARYGVCAILPR